MCTIAKLIPRPGSSWAELALLSLYKIHPPTQPATHSDKLARGGVGPGNTQLAKKITWTILEDQRMTKERGSQWLCPPPKRKPCVWQALPTIILGGEDGLEGGRDCWVEDGGLSSTFRHMFAIVFWRVNDCLFCFDIFPLLSFRLSNIALKALK